MSYLLRGSTEHLRAGACRHPRRRTSLCLTPTLSPSERCTLGDYGTDEPRVGKAGEDGREHAGATSSWRCDDDTHLGIHFLHGERAREDIAERRPGHWS